MEVRTIFSVGMAAKLGGALAVIVGLSIGLGTSAGAATDVNYVVARTQGNFALTFGSPGIPTRSSFGSRTAVNVSFRVNGQAYGHGGFSIAAEQGPSVIDPSGANASASVCQGCLTNAIAINVDVLSGPVRSVFVPTQAVAKNNYCLGCNTLAADYTFVVSPGTVAALTPAGLGDLYAIASQVVSEANTVEPSGALAAQVVSALGAIQAVLENPADLDPLGPSVAAAAVPQLQPVENVQRFGQTQDTTAVTG